MQDKITYDQPLNETVRVCLRLEQLFHQVDHQIDDDSLMGTRNIIHYIINILHILDRPDLKAKLAKELSQHLSNLSRYEKMPEIDAEKLNLLTHQIEDHSRILIDSSGKIGNRLRDVELLNTLRLHLASPGGGCSFDLPIYHYWLQQPLTIRQETIRQWLSEFAQIRTVTQLILNLVRNNAKSEEKTAIHGFYQELLDPQANLRMLRISIPHDIPAYPEISIGRHFLSVRFFSPDIERRPIQYPHDLIFLISYCNT